MAKPRDDRVGRGGAGTSAGVPLDQMEALFREIDHDNSGAIDAGELQRALELMGVGAGLAQAEELIRGVDDDGSGEIELEEFITILTTKLRLGTPPPRPWLLLRLEGGGETWDRDFHPGHWWGEASCLAPPGTLPLAGLATALEDDTALVCVSAADYRRVTEEGFDGELKRKVEFLSRCKLSQGGALARTDLRVLAFAARRRRFPARARLYDEGSPAGAVFLIESGTVRIDADVDASDGGGRVVVPERRGLADVLRSTGAAPAGGCRASWRTPVPVASLGPLDMCGEGTLTDWRPGGGNGGGAPRGRGSSSLARPSSRYHQAGPGGGLGAGRLHCNSATAVTDVVTLEIDIKAIVRLVNPSDQRLLADHCDAVLSLRESQRWRVAGATAAARERSDDLLRRARGLQRAINGARRGAGLEAQSLEAMPGLDQLLALDDNDRRDENEGGGEGGGGGSPSRAATTESDAGPVGPYPGPPPLPAPWAGGASPDRSPARRRGGGADRPGANLTAILDRIPPPPFARQLSDARRADEERRHAGPVPVGIGAERHPPPARRRGAGRGRSMTARPSTMRRHHSDSDGGSSAGRASLDDFPARRPPADPALRATARRARALALAAARRSDIETALVERRGGGGGGRDVGAGSSFGSGGGGPAPPTVAASAAPTGRPPQPLHDEDAASGVELPMFGHRTMLDGNRGHHGGRGPGFRNLPPATFSGDPSSSAPPTLRPLPWPRPPMEVRQADPARARPTEAELERIEAAASRRAASTLLRDSADLLRVRDDRRRAALARTLPPGAGWGGGGMAGGPRPRPNAAVAAAVGRKTAPVASAVGAAAPVTLREALDLGSGGSAAPPGLGDGRTPRAIDVVDDDDIGGGGTSTTRMDSSKPGPTTCRVTRRPVGNLQRRAAAATSLGGSQAAALRAAGAVLRRPLDLREDGASLEGFSPAQLGVGGLARALELVGLSRAGTPASPRPAMGVATRAREASGAGLATGAGGAGLPPRPPADYGGDWRSEMRDLIRVSSCDDRGGGERGEGAGGEGAKERAAMARLARRAGQVHRKDVAAAAAARGYLERAAACRRGGTNDARDRPTIGRTASGRPLVTGRGWAAAVLPVRTVVPGDRPG